MHVSPRIASHRLGVREVAILGYLAWVLGWELGTGNALCFCLASPRLASPRPVYTYLPYLVLLQTDGVIPRWAERASSERGPIARRYATVSSYVDM
jgi:hypothetical protein